MVTRDTAWAPGTPCWTDLAVDSVDKAIVFYGGLFGWEVERGGEEAGGYSMARLYGKNVAGLGPKQDSAQPSTWTTYLATDDADATVAKVKAAGGQVLVEVMDVMDVGRMAIATDVAGAVFGIWQSLAHTGAQIANEPGAMSWNENMSRDFEGNKKFYAEVFGYKFGDMSNEDFSYATLDLDGSSVGGIGALPADTPAEVPANWTTYFTVGDTDAAIKQIEELGGQVVAPAFDSPYGRMAVVSDDQGAVFAIIDQSAGTGD